MRAHDAKLLTVCADDPDFAVADLLIDLMLVFNDCLVPSLLDFPPCGNEKAGRKTRFESTEQTHPYLHTRGDAIVSVALEAQLPQGEKVFLLLSETVYLIFAALSTILAALI